MKNIKRATGKRYTLNRAIISGCYCYGIRTLRQMTQRFYIDGYELVKY